MPSGDSSYYPFGPIQVSAQGHNPLFDRTKEAGGSYLQESGLSITQDSKADCMAVLFTITSLLLVETIKHGLRYRLSYSETISQLIKSMFCFPSQRFDYACT